MSTNYAVNPSMKYNVVGKNSSGDLKKVPAETAWKAVDAAQFRMGKGWTDLSIEKWDTKSHSFLPDSENSAKIYDNATTNGADMYNEDMELALASHLADAKKYHQLSKKGLTPDQRAEMIQSFVATLLSAGIAQRDISQVLKSANVQEVTA